MAFRGTGQNYTRDMGYNPPRAQGRSGVPPRGLSTARMVERYHDMQQYENIHSYPPEHIELYDTTIPMRIPGDETSHLHFSTYHQNEIKRGQRMLDDYNRYLTGQVQDYPTKPRRGETMSSPRIRIIQSMDELRNNKFTGFRLGSNYSKEKYGIDSPAFGDSLYLDQYPELIENVPTYTPPPPDVFEMEAETMRANGEFNYPNRIELLSIPNRKCQLRPGNYKFRKPRH